MTLPTAWIVPVTPKGAEPTPSSPRPLLTPLTAPALEKLTAMAPLTTPAAVVLTSTRSALLFVAPAMRLAKLPVPVMRLAPVPLAAPKRAFRSSTKPAGPVALLVTLSRLETACPTCTVPKFRLGVLS